MPCDRAGLRHIVLQLQGIRATSSVVYRASAANDSLGGTDPVKVKERKWRSYKKQLLQDLQDLRGLEEACRTVAYTDS